MRDGAGRAEREENVEKAKCEEAFEKLRLPTTCHQSNDYFECKKGNFKFFPRKKNNTQNEAERKKRRRQGEETVKNV